MVHVTFSLIAIGAGAAVLMIPKGTRWHRTFGHIYATSMVGLIVTAFSIYDLTGSFSPFHVAAFLSAVTVAFGLNAVLGRRPKDRWIKSHAQWMSGSYIGLIAALAAESLTRFVMPRAAPLLEERSLWSVFWGLVIVASFGVIAVGWWLVKTRLPHTLQAFSGPKK